MQFVTIAAGESQQITGPWYGVRVLSAGVGAEVRIDQQPIPLDVLLSIPAPLGGWFDRVWAAGPVALQLADTPGEELTAAPSPSQGSLGRGVLGTTTLTGPGEWFLDVTENPETRSALVLLEPAVPSNGVVAVSHSRQMIASAAWSTALPKQTRWAAVGDVPEVAPAAWTAPDLLVRLPLFEGLNVYVQIATAGAAMKVTVVGAT